MSVIDTALLSAQSKYPGSRMQLTKIQIKVERTNTPLAVLFYRFNYVYYRQHPFKPKVQYAEISQYLQVFFRIGGRGG